jgi:photosystem II stability/assembly factor-like uncharacterized protein
MRLKIPLRYIFLFATFFLLEEKIFPQQIIDISDSCKSSFRGISVVNDSVLWVSGTNNSIGLSVNGGKSWQWNSLSSNYKMDFRSIYAFDERSAVIANAGYPAKIFRTEDAGKNWTEVYSSSDSAMFFDGIGFWNENQGIIYGDPIDGKMFLMKTEDKGKTWSELPRDKRPALEIGESSFAASGTTIRKCPRGGVMIATGGKISRLWHSADFGESWTSYTTPILQGKSSTGIFSIAISDWKVLIVGGDYTSDTLKKNHVFTGKFPGSKFRAPKIPTNGYRSCVEFIAHKTAIATGPTGSEITYNNGKTWKHFSDSSYNCVRRARYGTTVYFCGAKGKIGKLQKK